MKDLIDKIMKKVKEYNEIYSIHPGMLIISKDLFNKLTTYLHKNKIDYRDWNLKHFRTVEITERKNIIEIY